MISLSVITINYNNLTGLEKTINSILNQTHRDFEWIIIDGGSSDGSKELIEQISDRLSYWVSEPDKGIYNAMNKGIRMAKGEWLLFLNSGDWLCENTTLEKVFAQESSTADVMYGDKMQWTPDKSFLLSFPERLSLDYLVRYSICHQATFFRKELFIQEQYEETYSIASDWAFDIKLMLQGKRFEHIPVTVCYYDNTGISALGSEKQQQEKKDIIEKYIPYNLRFDLERFDKIQHLYNGRLCSFLTRCAFSILERISNFRDFINKKKGNHSSINNAPSIN